MEDKTLIAKLCAMMNLELSGDNVGQCELKHFDKLKAAELKAFIIARHPKYMMLSDVRHLKNPRGGKSMEGASTGVENCISIAFGVCNEKSRLVEINKRLDVAIVVTVAATSRILLYVLNCIEIKPSDIMKDSIFDANGKLSFTKWHDEMADANMFAEVLKKADLLFVMLSSCFQTHVKWKVKACQQSNRCLPWAKKNLALVACWMIVACYLKEDISCLDKSKCLLEDPSGNKFLVCSNEALNQLGCYLHYNRNESVWVPSGSATGEGGFGKRLKTHLERALSDRNDDDSRFYH
jgi:hypothetical protein